MTRTRTVCLVMALVLVTQGLPRESGAAPHTPAVRHLMQPDGVELWSRVPDSSHLSAFFSELSDFFNVAFGNGERLPFRQSVAFLVGVSSYRDSSSFKPLPFVRNDLTALRNYLLNEGGFDKVYVVSEAKATPALVESYMLVKFRNELDSRDRLLFYFSGHGADLAGATGYMLFANAKANDYGPDSAVAVVRAVEWSEVIKVSHILFIFDSCSAGLGFEKPRAGPVDALYASRSMIATLSKSGSRAVITAGTGGEETFEVPNAEGGGNGVFTHSLLAALRHSGGGVFSTLREVFAETERTMASYVGGHLRPPTPKMWELQLADYPGTFLFLRQQANRGEIPPTLGMLLGAKRKGGTDGGEPPPGSSSAEPAGPPLGSEQTRSYRFRGPFRMGRSGGTLSLFVTEPSWEAGFNGRLVQVERIRFTAETGRESPEAFTFDIEVALTRDTLPPQKSLAVEIPTFDALEAAMAARKMLHVTVRTDASSRVPQFNAPITWSFDAAARGGSGFEEKKFIDLEPLKVGESGLALQIFGWTEWGGGGAEHFIEFPNLLVEIDFKIVG